MSDEIQFSEQDMAEIEALGVAPGEPEPTFHPILMIWREVLRPAESERHTKITPTWANRIVTSFTEVTYADMPFFQESYFSKLLELGRLLDEEIATDDDCLTYTTPEEDASENAQHYRNVLQAWQLAVLQWELDWDTTAPQAGAELAAVSEVHKMFFGNTGLTQFLDNINFDFTDEDQQELLNALESLREANSE